MRKIKKIKYTKILTLIVFAYILFQISINVIGKNVETVVVQNESFELKVTAKGLIIRDEYLVKSNKDGNISITANNGERLKKNDTLAVIYNENKKIDENKKEITKLNKEIEELKLEYEKSNSELSRSLIEKKINTKKEQRLVLNNENNKNMTYLNTSTSGIISDKYDGYEEIYSLDNIENITKEDIDNTHNNYKILDMENKSVKESDIVARIIKDDYSYIAIYVDDSSVFEENQKVEIGFDNNKVQGIVEKIYTKDDNNVIIFKISNQNVEIYDTRVKEFDIIYKQIDGLKVPILVEKIYTKDDNNVIIFKISNQNVEIYDTRVKEFDIIYKQIDGLKVPIQSVKEVDDKKGVYVLNEETRKIDFIELKSIQYENEDFIFVDYYKNKKEGIKTIDVYDEIILKPNNINKNIKISRW